MDGSRIKSIFTRDKKKEELKPLEKAKAEEIVESLTKKVEYNYSLEEVDKAEKEAEKYTYVKKSAFIGKACFRYVGGFKNLTNTAHYDN